METISEVLQTGLDHHRAGRLQDAERQYRRVLEMHPRHGRAVHLIGLITYQVGNREKAVEVLLHAIKLDRFNAVIPADLGEIYHALGKLPEAAEACRSALALDPSLSGAHNCLGQIQLAEGLYPEAIASLREALALDPKLATAWARLGTALRLQGELAESQEAFQRTVRLAPENADNYMNLGVTLYDQGKMHDAIACYEKAIRLRPGFFQALYNAALARLALGDFPNGYRDFESRHLFESLARRRYSLPMLTSTGAPSETVLVHAEPGLGNTLQFIRYIPLLEQRGIRTVVDVQEELVPLLAESGFKNLQSDGSVPAGCGWQVPMLSLPRVFGSTLQSVPAMVPYLTARADLIAAWEQKLGAKAGFKVGINWAGSPEYYNDRARSIPLASFAPLAAVNGVRLISLQKMAGTEQLAEVAGAFAVEELGPEFDATHGRFMDSAAVIKNLDLVVTSDTSIAQPGRSAGRTSLGRAPYRRRLALAAGAGG